MKKLSMMALICILCILGLVGCGEDKNVSSTGQDNDVKAEADSDTKSAEETEKVTAYKMELTNDSVISAEEKAKADDNMEITTDIGEHRPESEYRNAPLPPNAEPNWIDFSETETDEVSEDSFDNALFDDMEIVIDEGEHRSESEYRNAPPPPNAGPNWVDF